MRLAVSTLDGAALEVRDWTEGTGQEAREGEGTEEEGQRGHSDGRAKEGRAEEEGDEDFLILKAR